MELSGTVAITGSFGETVTLELTRGQTRRPGGAAVHDGGFSGSPPKLSMSGSCEESKLLLSQQLRLGTLQILECIYANTKAGQCRQAKGLSWDTVSTVSGLSWTFATTFKCRETTIDRQQVHGGSREALAALPIQLIFCRIHLRIFEGCVCWGAMMSSTRAGGWQPLLFQC